MNNEELKKVIYAYTLKNSIQNNGIPNKYKICNSLLGHLKRNNETELFEQLKKEMKEDLEIQNEQRKKSI